jgi:Ribbon-helix-helix protein, copG family
VTVRLDPELKGRLAEAAAKLDLSETDIVRHALRAAVNAIEANDYKKSSCRLRWRSQKHQIKSHVRGARQAGAEYPRGAPINEVGSMLTFLIISGDPAVPQFMPKSSPTHHSFVPMLRFYDFGCRTILVDGGDPRFVDLHKQWRCCDGPINFQIGYFRQFCQKIVIHLIGQKRAILRKRRDAFLRQGT